MQASEWTQAGSTYKVDKGGDLENGIEMHRFEFLYQQDNSGLISGWSRQSSWPLSPAPAGEGAVEEPQWSVGLPDHQRGWGLARGVQWQDHRPLLCRVRALRPQAGGGAWPADDLQEVRHVLWFLLVDICDKWQRLIKFQRADHPRGLEEGRQGEDTLWGCGLSHDRLHWQGIIL